jgi:hypothetical protein
LLAAFLLARIDGKSPVEYLTTYTDQIFVRTLAKEFLADIPSRLQDMQDRWTEALSSRQI